MSAVKYVKDVVHSAFVEVEGFEDEGVNRAIFQIIH